jgi:RecB family endonuclease NucS
MQKAKDLGTGGVVVNPDGTTTTTAAPAAKPVDWNQVIESAMIKITGLLTLYVLITRINF